LVVCGKEVSILKSLAYLIVKVREDQFCKKNGKDKLINITDQQSMIRSQVDKAKVHFFGVSPGPVHHIGESGDIPSTSKSRRRYLSRQLI